MANPYANPLSLEEALNNVSLTANDSTDSASDLDDHATDNGGISITTPPDSGVGTGRFFRLDSNRNHVGAMTPVSGSGAMSRRAGRPPAPSFIRNGFSNSHTWVSSDTKHMQDFVIVRNAMRRLFKHADIAKWKYADYIAHREAMLASEKARVQRQVKAKEEDRQRQLQRTDDQNSYAHSLGYKVTSVLYTVGNRSLVLGEQTIWCVGWQAGKEEIAPWPSIAELKWEGDDRAKTSVGRFFPLPRECGAPGIQWSQLQVIEQYALDQVARIPTMEDIYLPVDEIDDNVKYDLITKDLEEAMDAYLET